MSEMLFLHEYETGLLLNHIKTMFQTYIAKYGELPESLKNRETTITNYKDWQEHGTRLFAGPMIQYRQSKRSPASFEKPFSGTFKRLAPGFREQHIDPLGNKATSFFTMYYDNLIEFTISSTSDDEMRTVALQFEKFMHTARDVVRAKGLPDFFYDHSGEEDATSIGGQLIYFVPLYYYVKTVSSFMKDEAILRELELAIEVSKI